MEPGEGAHLAIQELSRMSGVTHGLDRVRYLGGHVLNGDLRFAAHLVFKVTDTDDDQRVPPGVHASPGN